GVSINVTVPAGFSLDPATGKVVHTSATFLKNILAHIDKVKDTAQVFKAAGATVVVAPTAQLTPTKGNNGVGNGQDPQPPGNPPVNDGPGTGPGNPGNRHHGNAASPRPSGKYTP